MGWYMSVETTYRMLEENVGRIVLIKMKGDIAIRGKLSSYDQHLNIVLEEAEEIKADGSSRKLGTIVIRGDTVVLVSPIQG
ncbi:LSm family protein [Thermogladius sp. 4427co]|uniref:LSm family protein n=1 Tax=Thermogladius sp. 4427co TaxID=3450718 RepID=UPI003F7A94F9